MIFEVSVIRFNMRRPGHRGSSETPMQRLAAVFLSGTIKVGNEKDQI